MMSTHTSEPAATGAPAAEGHARVATSILLIIVAGLGLRLVGVWLPYLDSLAQRQAQGAMVAMNLYRDGMTVWCPRLDIFGVSTGCTVLEFPLFTSIAAAFYYLVGPHDAIGRLVSIAFWIATTPFLVRLSRRFLGPTGVVAAVALYTFSPMNIYFSRTFMGESSLMFFMVAAVATFLDWRETRRASSYAASVLFIGLALLTKPTAAVVLAPILIWWWSEEGIGLARSKSAWGYVLVAAVPFVAWAAYANYVNVRNPDMPVIWQRWDAIITKFGNVASFWISPLYYRNVIFWIGGVLLTPLGWLGAAAGLWLMPRGREKLALLAWLGAQVVTMMVLAGATYEHSYYHLPYLPAAALLFGYAVERAVDSGAVQRAWRERRAIAVGAAIATVALYSAGYYVFYAYMYDTTFRLPYAPAVARIVQASVPPGRGVVLNQPGDTTQALTYQIQRQTWDWKLVARGSGQAAIGTLEALRRRGASAYLAIETKYGNGVAELEKDPKFRRYLDETYPRLAATPHYVIYDLGKPRIPDAGRPGPIAAAGPGDRNPS
jgi:hypothetical protein